MRLGGGTALSDATPSVPPQVPVEDKEAARSLVHSILALFPIQDIPRTRVLYWNLTGQAELLPCRCGYKAPILWSRLSSATHQLQPGSHVCRRVSPGRLWATPMDRAEPGLHSGVVVVALTVSKARLSWHLLPPYCRRSWLPLAPGWSDLAPHLHVSCPAPSHTASLSAALSFCLLLPCSVLCFIVCHTQAQVQVLE